MRDDWRRSGTGSSPAATCAEYKGGNAGRSATCGGSRGLATGSCRGAGSSGAAAGLAVAPAAACGGAASALAVPVAAALVCAGVAGLAAPGLATVAGGGWMAGRVVGTAIGARAEPGVEIGDEAVTVANDE